MGRQLILKGLYKGSSVGLQKCLQFSIYQNRIIVRANELEVRSTQVLYMSQLISKNHAVRSPNSKNIIIHRN
jgi:hypothetical protein